MFPNPQDALPLPPRPSTERYRKIAKELANACKSDAPNAIHAWAAEWVASLVRLSKLEIGPELPVSAQSWADAVTGFAQREFSRPGRKCLLTSAQFVISRSHGFESWPRFTAHLAAAGREGSRESRFEAAADAIVWGDIATLKRLLREDPSLARARSQREHRAALLHYVSANGVEGYRQKTPDNIVEIAALLLDAGAEIDATANVYGGGCTTLGLAATSIHPERARVQEALLQKLLDHGAGMDQPSAAGNHHSIVTGCLANGRRRAAEFLADKGAPLNLAEAAGVGRVDLVEKLQPGAGNEQLKSAFFYACAYGRNRIAEFLLASGADIASQDAQGQTGLHLAVIGAQLETVKLLLRHKAPLGVKNRYGGDVAGQALWSAAHGGDPDAYSAIFDALTAAGAKIPRDR